MKLSTARGHHGFSLVEVSLALGIVSFAILSTLSLLVVGLDMSRDSVANTEAASIAREVAADLRMGEDWTNPSPRFQIAPPPSGSTSPITLYVDADGSYRKAADTTRDQQIESSFRVDVSFGPSAGTVSPTAHIVVSWPTGVAGNGTWPVVERCSTFEAVASLGALRTVSP